MGFLGSQEVERVDTIIGPGVEVKGTFISKTTIRVEGRVEGNLQSEGDVIIGREGRVKGDIHARNVILGGRLNGNVFGDSKVEIHAGGQLFGDVKSPVVVMMEGAIFEGHCEMSGKEKGKILELNGRDVERSERLERRSSRES